MSGQDIPEGLFRAALADSGFEQMGDMPVFYDTTGIAPGIVFGGVVDERARLKFSETLMKLQTARGSIAPAPLWRVTKPGADGGRLPVQNVRAATPALALEITFRGLWVPDQDQAGYQADPDET